MITRHDFMVSGITATGAGIIVPPVFAQSVFAATMDDIHNDHVLVILQLGGGNDGLNTVVPYADPAYLAGSPNDRDRRRQGTAAQCGDRSQPGDAGHQEAL